MATKKFIVQLNQPDGEYCEELGDFWSYDEAKKFAEDYKVKSGLTPLQTIVDMCNASSKAIYDFVFSYFDKECVELEILTIEYDEPTEDIDVEWETIEKYCLMPNDLKESKDLCNFFRSLNIDTHDINFV